MYIIAHDPSNPLRQGGKIPYKIIYVKSLSWFFEWTFVF